LLSYDVWNKWNRKRGKPQHSHTTLPD
jgi:hypothetical protein